MRVSWCFLVLLLFKEWENSLGLFSHEWAAEITGGEEVAKIIAKKNNFEYLGKILPDIYHLRHRRLAKRSLSPSTKHHNSLTSEPEVRWAEQQTIKRRVKRDLKYTWRDRFPAGEIFTNLSDPKWHSMWYLNRGRGLDMNVQRAWAAGATGQRVVVTILDDGLEKDHPDIIQNYDPNASFDVNGHDPDPMPRYDVMDSNRHGTRCAGEVAAVANNSICAVGVAYEASVGGVRMLDGDVTDAVEARSLSHNPNHIDIYSASWGPDDDGKTVDGPGKLATRAFVNGIVNGRNGKGSIFVWASGNGGRDKDNCNCDGYTNAIWTLSISSVTEKGRVPWYSEACSSTLASTYSSGAYGERQIVTTDLHHKCTEAHSGTSASAPLAAGICALALHANRDLTWRDMQHIVVRTARPAHLEDDHWQINGVGRSVSHRFGYGLMDAYAMVELARNWTTVPPQRECEAHATQLSGPNKNKMIPQKSYVTVTLEVTECPGVRFLEHVQSKVSLLADDRGTIEIFLISPAGTKSTLLAKRPKDRSRTGFHSWPFMTVHMWGESPLGIWKLEIHNNVQYFAVGKATLQDWSLIFHGTKVEPGQKMSDISLPVDNRIDGPSTNHITHLRDEKPEEDWEKERNSEQEPRHPMSSSLVPTAEGKSAASSISNLRHGCTAADIVGNCLGCMGEFKMYNGSCVETCPEHTYLHSPDEKAVYFTPRCISCHYSCSVCSGPFDYQCIQCWPDAKLQNNTKEEQFCHATFLLDAYEQQAIIMKYVLIALSILMLLVLCTATYVYTENKRKVENIVNSLPLTALSYGVTKVTTGGEHGSSYSPVQFSDSVKLIHEVPFRDSTSDEEEL